MPIHPQLIHRDEAQFRDEFVVPLLHRLGFGLVCNFHGTREFGKDLVVSDVDKFGHNCHHGMQVKYLPIISLARVQELIADCQQAFANEFRHPHTGSMNRISTFFAVTAGSISQEARDHFFNSLVPAFGDNVRLLDGTALSYLARVVPAGTNYSYRYFDARYAPTLEEQLIDESRSFANWLDNEMNISCQDLVANLRDSVPEPRIRTIQSYVFHTYRDMWFRQAKWFQMNGRYFQGNKTMQEPPSALRDERVEVVGLTHQVDTWRDLGYADEYAPVQLTCDQYLGPKGHGYEVFARFIHNDPLWVNTFHWGPEDYRNERRFKWHSFKLPLWPG